MSWNINMDMSQADNSCQKLTKYAHQQFQTRSPQYQCTHHVWWKSIDIYLSYNWKRKYGQTDGHTTDGQQTFVLRFYRPANPMGSCRAQSVYLTTILLGRLSPLAFNQYCAHSFASNCQLPFLNQGKGENVCLFVLRFYGPVDPMESYRVRSVYLTACLLGRLSPLSG